jgi:hypothetical protein
MICRLPAPLAAGWQMSYVNVAGHDPVNSQGGVQFPTGGKARERLAHSFGMHWCQQIRLDSGADGIVRMKENG